MPRLSSFALFDMLPIYDIQIELAQALTLGNRIILQAPTGSGKSTQVPQMVLDAGLVDSTKEIVVMQPRRLAARMLAKRVASERKSALGNEVGYQVRLDRKAGPETRIRYVTEGILLREWLNRPQLSHVGCLIFDEFHERHLYGDLSLAHALHLQATARPDLLIILMSATLDTEPLQTFLPDAQLLSSEGRSFPVDIHYLERDPRAHNVDIWQSASDAANRLADRNQGDLLIFMPGRFEIDRTLDALKRSPLGKKADCLPLHGELPPQEQDRAVTPSSRQRVIVATNIAETSLTIEGVTGVIDSGLARVARFDPVRGIDQLNVEPISRASADQRAGRAGRTAPGQCVRLWTEAGHRTRPQREAPEIHRVDLSEAVLTFAALGIQDWSELALADPPEEQTLRSTREFLHQLGALDKQGAITTLGQNLLQYPAHPRIGRLMIEAEQRGVTDEAALIAALLQARPLLLRKIPSSVRQEQLDLFSGDGSSDLLMNLRACQWAIQMRYDRQQCQELGIHAQTARQALQTAQIFLRKTKETTPAKEPNLELRKCLAVAFADHLALKRPHTKRCDLVDGRVAEIGKESICDKAELMVAAEIRDFERAKTPFLTGVTRVEPEWLSELWPDLFEASQVVRYDEQSKRVLAESRKQFGQLILESKLTHEVSDDDAGRLLMQAVNDGKVPLPHWDKNVDNWITRLNCLSLWRPDWELPPLTPSDRDLLLEHMLSTCRTRKDVKNLNVRAQVENWLSPMQQTLVIEHCPTSITLPNGRNARIRYQEGAPPIISSKLQDFLGMTESPRVAGGQVACSVEMLAPNGRPAALTEDLKNFWDNGYLLVRKDLKGRYPKHNWP
ncbi:ATP-dependent helicase HrpB [Kiritimatiellota bacterium B12222]|nr:ATP-dependent helicase HrpB [Kiritimatiellota bacterium B12222]